ncbi:MAG: hypothetical protein ACKVZH_06655 [Blastocatellia bacterium]
MESILFDIGISAVFTALREAIKNPDKKAKLKRVMLKIKKQIEIVFGDDPDFQ